MKTKLALAALSLVSLAVANTAVASDYKFKDTGAFTATGSLTATALAVSLPCSATLTGTTSSGAQISAGTFSGLSCLLLTPGNMPWKMHANAMHGFTIKGMEVSALVLGVCGPGSVKAQLNNAGNLTITGAGLPGLVPCSIDANLKTQPKLVIKQKK
jgi:hypothetical protein